MKEMASKLLFQKLDRPRQRWLSDMTPSGRLRETQMFTYCKKMPDLVHLHAFYLLQRRYFD